MYYKIYHSPIGKLYLVSDGVYLTGCYLENQKYFPNKLNYWKENKDLMIFKNSEDWLKKYFNKENPDIDNVDIKFEGTDFRILVWEILRKIPYGKTTTYKDIADEIVKIKDLDNMSAQAVGNAVAHNPLLIFIPCHRVVAKNKFLVGFAAGIENKKLLLDLEGNN